MLLEADADIRLEDDLGFTVFNKAERSKRREAVLRLLRSKGNKILSMHQNLLLYKEELLIFHVIFFK